jgi:hypothetical protein
MGIGKKKGKSGIATQYVTRVRAMKKLQVSLQDFRYSPPSRISSNRASTES